MEINDLLISNNKCAKLTVSAIIHTKDGEVFFGSNSCGNPQTVCPRDIQGMKSGEGYHLCKEICQQEDHAEVSACKAAGEQAKGATLILLGHTYCCDHCIKTMEEYGIKKVIIVKNY